MSTRLTKDLRAKIRDNVIHDTFSARLKAQAVREQKLAERALEHKLGGHVMTWHESPRYLLNTNMRGCTSVDICVRGQRLPFRVPPDWVDAGRVPGFALSIDPEKDNALANEVVAARQMREDIEAEMKRVRAHVTGVLESVNTTKRLVEIWPEIERLIPVDETRGKEIANVTAVKQMIKEAAHANA